VSPPAARTLSPPGPSLLELASQNTIHTVFTLSAVFPMSSPAETVSPPSEQQKSRAVVRENFSLPPSDSELIEVLRRRAAREGVLLNRSELLRASLAALNRLSDAEIAAIGEQVPKIRTGRPAGR
jgi:hypothetical protein